MHEGVRSIGLEIAHNMAAAYVAMALPTGTLLFFGTGVFDPPPESILGDCGHDHSAGQCIVTLNVMLVITAAAT